jgi:DNA-binding YbaB/EbfC family protein
MKDLMGLMKQAQAMQQQMADAQEKLARTEVHGEAGAGLVRIVLTAKGDAKSVSIDPSLLQAEEPVMVEDLILAAHNDARRKAEALQQEIMAEAAGGLQLPPGLVPPS